MAASKLDIYIEQGTTFSLGLVWKDGETPIDLTGYIARMHLRSSVIAEDTLMTLTTEDGGITLGGAAGTIGVVASRAKTTLITSKKGVYDLELESPGGVVTRLIEGSAVISPEVTRE